MTQRARSRLGRYGHVLCNSISAEARAYGFSVVLLTVGYLTVSERGLPGAGGAFAYMGGALGAQCAVAVAAFRRPTKTWSSGESVKYYAPVAVHLASVVAAVLVGWGVAAAITLKDGAFAGAGFCSILVYQLLLALELTLGLAGDEQM